MDCNHPKIKRIEKRIFTLAKRIDNSWRDAYVRDVQRDYAGQIFPDSQLDSSFTFSPTNLDDDWTVPLSKHSQPPETIETPMNCLCINLDTHQWSSKTFTYDIAENRCKSYQRTKRQMDYKYVKNGHDLLQQIASTCKDYASTFRHTGYIFRLEDHIDLYLQLNGVYHQRTLSDATLQLSDPIMPMQDLEGKEVMELLQKQLDTLETTKCKIYAKNFMQRTLAQFMGATLMQPKVVASVDVRECSNICFRAKKHIDDENLTAILNSNFGTFGSKKSPLDNFYLRRLINYDYDFFPFGVHSKNCQLAHFMSSPEHMLYIFNEYLRCNRTLGELNIDRDPRTRNFMDVMTFALNDYNHMTLKFCLDCLRKAKRERVRIYARSLLERGAGIVAAILQSFLFDAYIYQRKKCEEEIDNNGMPIEVSKDSSDRDAKNRIELRIAMRGYMRMSCEPLNLMIRKYLYRISDLLWPSRMPKKWQNQYIRPKFYFSYYKNTKTPGIVKCEALRRLRFENCKKPLKSGLALKLDNPYMYPQDVLKDKWRRRKAAIAEGKPEEEWPDVDPVVYVHKLSVKEQLEEMERDIDYSAFFN